MKQFFDPNEHVNYNMTDRQLQMLNSTKTLIKLRKIYHNLVNEAKTNKSILYVSRLIKHISY